MRWNDIRKPDKNPALVDSVVKALKKDELWETRVGVLSRQEMGKESYSETRYT
jgi:hypothetical protein